MCWVRAGRGNLCDQAAGINDCCIAELEVVLCVGWGRGGGTCVTGMFRGHITATGPTWSVVPPQRLTTAALSRAKPRLSPPSRRHHRITTVCSLQD